MSDFVSKFAVDDERQKYFIYRITGKQSIERLDPLIQRIFINNDYKINDDDDKNYDNDDDGEKKIMYEKLIPITVENYQTLHQSLDFSTNTTSVNNKSIIDNVNITSSQQSSLSPSLPLSSFPLILDFVWETTCEKSFKDYHKHSRVINKLHNSSIIESKACLAYLQLLFNDNDARNHDNNDHHHHQVVHVLPTYVASRLSEIKYWASHRWGTCTKETITTNLPSPNTNPSTPTKTSLSILLLQSSTITSTSSLIIDDKTTENNKDCHDLYTISSDNNNNNNNVDSKDIILDDDHYHVHEDVHKQHHADDDVHKQDHDGDDDDDDDDYDWWVLKASKSNGGREVWVLNRSNYQKVMTPLIEDDEYILQK